MKPTTQSVGYLRSLIRSAAAAGIFIMAIAARDDGVLRGAVEPSSDGQTYLGVLDPDSPECGPIYVDGKKWQQPLGTVRPVSPGRHCIRICREVLFEVKPGTTFLIDYWSP